MAEWTIVLSLVCFGLILVVVEVIFIPGTTFVGVAGFICIIIGVALAFRYFGSETGWLALGGSTALTGVLFYLALRSDAWKKFALSKEIDGRMNEVEPLKFPVGMEGVALSALRPVGKGEFGLNSVEVKTLGEYVDTGTRIRIVKLLPNQVIVESVK